MPTNSYMLGFDVDAVYDCSSRLICHGTTSYSGLHSDCLHKLVLRWMIIGRCTVRKTLFIKSSRIIAGIADLNKSRVGSMLKCEVTSGQLLTVGNALV